jgi:hypothetical protein
MIKKVASFWSGIPPDEFCPGEAVVFCIFPILFLLIDVAMILGAIKIGWEMLR